MNGDFWGVQGGTGDADCHSQCAHWLRNDTLQGVRWGGPSGKSAKRCQWQRKRAGFEEVPRLAATTVAGNRLARRWATAGPYGSVTRGAMGGRPQGSPLRKGCKRCGVRADVGIGPYGYIIVSAVVGGRGRTPPLRRVTRSDCLRGRAAALHQGSFLQRSSVLWTTWATLWPRPG